MDKNKYSVKEKVFEENVKQQLLDEYDKKSKTNKEDDKKEKL